jgi:hypothetical protein
MTGLSIGETGVAKKETEAPPLDFHFLPGLRASRDRNQKLEREGAPRERESLVMDRQRLDGHAAYRHPPLPASTSTCDIESVIPEPSQRADPKWPAR